MSDNKIGPGSLPPTHNQSQVNPKENTVTEPPVKKYIVTDQLKNLPERKSIFSRRVIPQPAEKKLNKEQLDRIRALVNNKSYQGLQSALTHYVQDLEQFHYLIEKLPTHLSNKIKSVLAHHAGGLIAEDIVNTLNDTELSLTDQLDQMGEYMVRIGTSESPVRTIATSRTDTLLEKVELDTTFRSSVSQHIENVTLVGLSQRMNRASEKLLTEGALDDEQRHKIELQKRQIQIELSAYLD